MYNETKIFCEGLQNYDASFLNYGDTTNTDISFFYDKIMNSNDTDLSNILIDPNYNSTYFIDNSNSIHDLSGIEKDIKYFNNVSHILSDYYSKNMVINDE
jgi:hypothetical protein